MVADILPVLFRQLGRNVPDDLRQIRRSNNLTLASQSEQLLWRLSHGRPLATVRANVELAWQLCQSAPIMCPTRLDVAHQGSWCLTEWPLAAKLPPERQAQALGHCLATLHQGEPPARLPMFGTFNKIAAWLQRAHVAGLPSQIHTYLHQQSEQIIANMRAVIITERTLLHGDAHIGNLVEYQGRPVFIDLDDLCTGPGYLDLVPSFVSARRLLTPTEHWKRVCDAYNRPLPDGPHWETACRYRELTLIAWLASLWGPEKVNNELRHRVATFEQPPGAHAPWHSF